MTIKIAFAATAALGLLSSAAFAETTITVATVNNGDMVLT